MDVKQGSSYTKVTVRPRKSEQFRPTKAFVSSTPTVAVVGRNVTLRCFFSGNPAPTILFTRRDRSLPLNRITISKQDTELLIRDVQPEDEGDYVCRASNIVDSAEEIIQIDVQAAPVFRQWADRPHDINVTNGDTVVFMCNAEAEPAANILWMKNGKPLDDKNLPAKFELSDNKRKLTISDVCKDCEDGSSDLQVIQCNASNVHGYAFGTGYVNVLLKTQLRNASDIRVSVDQYQSQHFEFPCSALSDDLTPVTLKWFHYMSPDKQKPVQNDTDRVVVSSNGSLILKLEENDTKSWVDFHGEFMCQVTNGYSNATRHIFLHVNNYIPPTEPASVAVVSASLADSWWLFVIIAMVVLFILLIGCTVYFVHYRGDTYQVDQKERLNGNNPEKELTDSGFHDYQRPQSELLKGSRGTLGSNERLNSDDGGSLNGYGDDVGKFTEDGSFVGVYATAERMKPQNRSGSQTQLY
jgi:receptor-type tyrosine-protein phosphatase zeta